MDAQMEGDALAQFRAAMLGDAALQAALDAHEDVDAFIPEAVARAHALGLTLTDEMLRPALRGDPLGVTRWSSAPVTRAAPQAGWLPIHVMPQDGQICIDWGYFGERRLGEPFFEDSIRQAMRRPLNRLARHRTFLGDIAAHADAHLAPAPSGFIFHMSRCGSTLACQMLADDPRNIVISEASPLDMIVQLPQIVGPLDAELHASLLRAMVAALGRRRADVQERLVIKLDSWHALALPLFRRAFPHVPWAFFYREPKKVLASQMRERGMQTVPEYLAPQIFGLTQEDSLPPEDYCARLLARTCEAVLEPYARGGGLLVAYRQLPEALWTTILPHFGIACGDDDRARMARVAQFDAKTPSMTFASLQEGRAEMPDGLDAVAERHMGDIYRRLEDLRRRGAAAI